MQETKRLKQFMINSKKTAVWLARNEKSQSIPPTVLVNNVLITLLGNDALGDIPNRRYFFAAASRGMRRLLVDEARKRNALKRGGGFERSPLEETLHQFESSQIDLVVLNESLQLLEDLHPRQADVVHLKFFVQMSMKEIASCLEVSLTTVENDWRIAKAFLFAQLEASD